VSEYLNTKELAAAYPALFSVSMLKKSRMKYADTSGPPHFNIGRKVVYDRSEVEAWLSGKEGRSAQGRAAGACRKTAGRPVV
jgi:hypothetical protein